MYCNFDNRLGVSKGLEVAGTPLEPSAQALEESGITPSLEDAEKELKQLEELAKKAQAPAGE